jgi:hypothetical protein
MARFVVKNEFLDHFTAFQVQRSAVRKTLFSLLQNFAIFRLQLLAIFDSLQINVE